MSLFVCVASRVCITSCAVQYENHKQTVLLASLLSVSEMFVPAVDSKYQFFSQMAILIIDRCWLKYYLQSCSSLLLFSSVPTHEWLNDCTPRHHSAMIKDMSLFWDVERTCSSCIRGQVSDYEAQLMHFCFKMCCETHERAVSSNVRHRHQSL